MHVHTLLWLHAFCLCGPVTRLFRLIVINDNIHDSFGFVCWYSFIYRIEWHYTTFLPINVLIALNSLKLIIRETRLIDRKNILYLIEAKQKIRTLNEKKMQWKMLKCYTKFKRNNFDVVNHCLMIKKFLTYPYIINF